MLKGVCALDGAQSPLGGASVVLSGGRDHGALEVWTLRLADVDVALLDAAVLDAQERDRAASLARSTDRLGYTAAHVVLRELLSRRLGVLPVEVAFRREPCPSCGGPNGRPILEGEAGPLHFSMSRSGGVVLIGIASVRVGVDLEVFPREPTVSEASALLHADERTEIFSAPPSQQTEVFTRLWTRKEAYLKGIGTGIAHDLDADYLGTLPNAARPRGWTVLDVPVAAGYVAAAAIQLRPDERDASLRDTVAVPRLCDFGRCAGQIGR